MLESSNYFWNLINRSQQGQKKSFVELATFYQKDVYQHALKLCGNGHLAKNITNDVFIKAWENIKYLTENSPFKIWLNGLTVSITASFYQKNKKKINEAHDQNLILDNDYDSKFISLSLKERLVLMLHDLEGYSISDCSVMLNETKVNELLKDLDNVRRIFSDSETIKLLSSYKPEEWRKVTQDFEYWITELDSESSLPDDIRLVKNYRLVLINFLSKNDPPKELLEGLIDRLSNESKIEEEQKKIEEKKHKTSQNKSKHLPTVNKIELTSEAAEIFSNPNDVKEQFSKKLNLVKKQKRFVSNLSYILIFLNLIVLGYIFNNLVQNVTWETNSSLKITGHENIKFDVGDVIETNNTENVSIKIESVGSISLAPNTAIEIEKCDLNSNILRLNSGVLHLTTNTFFNRLNISVDKFTIKDFGSVSSITYSQDNNKLVVEVNKGTLHIISDNQTIPVPEGYMYSVGEIASYTKMASKEYISILNNLSIPISHTKELSKILTMSTKQDAITLWILLQNSNYSTKEVIFKKIAENIKLPDNLNLQKILNNNKEHLKILLEEIEWQI